LQVTRQSGAYHVDLGEAASFTVPDSSSALVLAGALVDGGGGALAKGALLRSGQRAEAIHGGRLLCVGRPLVEAEPFEE
jgi:hypothetical protein